MIQKYKLVLFFLIINLGGKTVIVVVTLYLPVGVNNKDFSAVSNSNSINTVDNVQKLVCSIEVAVGSGETEVGVILVLELNGELLRVK